MQARNMSLAINKKLYRSIIVVSYFEMYLVKYNSEEVSFKAP